MKHTKVIAIVIILLLVSCRMHFHFAPKVRVLSHNNKDTIVNVKDTIYSDSTKHKNVIRP